MGITAPGIVLVALDRFWATSSIGLLQLALVVYLSAQDTIGMLYPGETQAMGTMTPLIALAGYAILSIVIWCDTAPIRGARRRGNHPRPCVLDRFSAALSGHIATGLVSPSTIGSLAFYLRPGCVT